MTPSTFSEEKNCEGAGPGIFTRLEQGDPALRQLRSRDGFHPVSHIHDSPRASFNLSVNSGLL